MYDPGQRITFKTTFGPVALEASYLFEPIAADTPLTSRISMQAAGFLGLTERLIAAGLRRDMKANFATLKDLLESPTASISPQLGPR